MKAAMAATSAEVVRAGRNRRAPTGSEILQNRLRDALRLPYAPTGAQRRAVAEIEGDPMPRIC